VNILARRTKEEALETRIQLLDAAENLFSEKGVSHTSLNEIAETAGVTRGAVYHHFKNKPDLIDALFERAMLPVDEMLNSFEAKTAVDPLGQIRQQAIEILRRAVHDRHTRAMFTILFHKCEYVEDTLPIKQRHLEGRNECAAEVRSMFRAAVEAGQLPAETDVDCATMGIFGYIDGLVYQWLLDPDYFPLDEKAEYFVDIYIEGLRAIDTAVTSG
jgi:TetR/AcrR family acrAB operon transcriptional repressor